MLSLDLSSTDDLSLAIAKLPKPARDNYHAWRKALEPLAKMRGVGTGAALREVAAKMAVPPKTARNKLDALRKYGPAGLIDRRLAGPAWWRTNGDQIGLSEDEQKQLRVCCYDNAESVEHGLRAFRAAWRRGEITTELPRNPVTGYPRGYSLDNLRHYAPSPYQLKMIHIGRGAAASLGPMTFTTRANLWPLSHVMIDDVWHDFMVSIGKQAGRPLEFGILDVMTGSRFRHGTRVRLKNEATGVNEGLKKQDVNMLLAAAFFLDGYSTRGTTIMGELGTAKVYDEIAELLSDASGGLIRVREPGITGDEQALLGAWRGGGKGNFRFKSPLESLHRRMHIEFASIPGQTGRDVDRRPEGLSGLLDHHDEIMKAAARLGWERCQLLRLPLLQYHAEYLPLSMELHHALDCREEHELEGWHELGFVETQFRLEPGTEDWMDRDRYLALPGAIREALHAEVLRAPRQYSRPCRLSPFQARRKSFGAARQRGELPTIGGHTVCAMLSDFFTREGERVDGAYFCFQDGELAPGDLRYEARITEPDGTERELRDGERFNVLTTPFDLDHLFVMGPKNNYLGVARRDVRADRASTVEIERKWGRVETRTKDRLAQTREDLAPREAAIVELREHNARVMAGAPVTPAEKATARAMGRGPVLEAAAFVGTPGVPEEDGILDESAFLPKQ